MTPGTMRNIAIAREREDFVRMLTHDIPEQPEPPAICDYCRIIDEVPAVVRYGDNLYCGRHARDELICDLGRHGQLAIPALAFAGSERC